MSKCQEIVKDRDAWCAAFHGVKLNIQKAKIMSSGPIISWQIDRETVEIMTDFIGLQNHCRW